jgi:transposase
MDREDMEQPHGVEPLPPKRREGTDRSGGGRTAGVDPEVAAVAKRRMFSASYKLKILAETDRCRNGELGLLLRREGLYSSQVYNWRKWRVKMGKQTGKKAGKSGRENELEKEVARLQRENTKLGFKLKRAEGLVELQKKAAALFAHLDEQNEKSE